MLGYATFMGLADRFRHAYTWDDYRTWDDGERWELIGGEPFCMSPAPASRHQAIVTDLVAQLHQHFKGRQCRPLVSPVDVKLSAEDVVQPDAIVVCDPSQIRETHVEGPPTLAVEVLSPSSHRHDRVRKLRLYARFGILEYWLIQPNPAVVEVLQLAGDGYRIAGVYTDREILRSPAFPELVLDLTEVFTLPLPAAERIDEIRESAPPYGAGPPKPPEREKRLPKPPAMR